MLILGVSKCGFLVAINVKVFTVYIRSILGEHLKIFNVGVAKT